MKLIDSHCHIHDSQWFEDVREDVYRRAIEAEVAMVCVGTDAESSRETIEFCRTHELSYPVVGIHPHDAASADPNEIEELVRSHRDMIVGIGEIGLDYHYDNSPRDIQREAFEAQLDLARKYNLPVSFHVREAKNPSEGSVWDDFWAIFDNNPSKGVLHSFTDTTATLDRGLARGLSIGVNGICTFTKDEDQQAVFEQIPLEKLLLETDAPFLTPKPFRGKMNEPTYVGVVAGHIAALRDVPYGEICKITTDNARGLYRLP